LSLFRLIARLDIKSPNLVKGVHLEGLRIIGDPHDYAVKYANEGVDEILYMDIVASLYGRNQLTELLARTVDDIFVPVTVGGGVKSLADVRRLFNAGADKVAINTAVLHRPDLIREIADKYGSQAIVVSIEAKKTPTGWEAYTDNGREKTGKDAVAWANKAAELGAGEILLTSIDCEGTGKGMDLELGRAITPNLDIPVTLCGGCGNATDVAKARQVADAVAVAGAFHYGKMKIADCRKFDILQK